MKLVNQLKELQDEGVITPDTALDISNYYKSKGDQSTSRLTVIYSVIGSVLIGLGLILLFAHNWDAMSKTARTIVAIAPLLITQIFGGYFIYKKPNNLGGREGIGALNFISIGLSISLISQTYNIPGSLDAFFFTWILLAAPMLFLLRSSMIAFLLLSITTWYGIMDGDLKGQLTFIGGVGLVLTHFRGLIQKTPSSNYINLASWIIPAALAIGLIMFEHRNDELLFLGYFWLFTLFTWIGNSKSWGEKSIARNGMKLIGPLGILTMLSMISFDKVAEGLIRYKTDFGPEWLSLILIGIPLVLVITLKKGLFNKLNKDGLSMAIIPVTLVFFFSGSGVFTAIIINVLLLLIGVQRIITGLKDNLLGQLNLGLLIITCLVSYRFFDHDMSFIVRGIIFLLLGAGFLGSNLWIIKKRKNETK